MNITYCINNKLIHVNKKGKKIIVKAGKNIYEFNNYKEAKKANLIKSSFGEWLNLRDIEKISKYQNKILKIELKKLKIGENIFICNMDHNECDDYDDEKVEQDIEVKW